MATIERNIDEFTGWTGNDTDDAAAFLEFIQWAKPYSDANPDDTIKLIIPEGAEARLATNPFGGGYEAKFFAQGIKRFICEGAGTGAQIRSAVFLASQHGYQNIRSSARFSTAQKGSRRITIRSYPTTAITQIEKSPIDSTPRLTIGSTADFTDGGYVTIANALVPVVGTDAEKNLLRSFNQKMNVNGQLIRKVDSTHIDLVTVNNGYATVWTGIAGTAGGNPALLFSAGDWITLTGMDIQGQWKLTAGQPPNHYFFEYAQIESVVHGVTESVITLTKPIKNTYLDTWPSYNSGKNTLEPDQGGPATIYKMHAYWNSEVEYRNITFISTVQLLPKCREATFVDCTFPNYPVIPTNNLIFRAINTNWSSLIEFDKVVDTVYLRGCTSLSNVEMQSSSFNNTIVLDSDIQGSLKGIGKRVYVKNTDIENLWIGPYAYGAGASSTVFEDCTVTDQIYPGGYAHGDSIGTTLQYPYDYYNIATIDESGVLVMPNHKAVGDGPSSRWIIPGTQVYYASEHLTEGSFKVLSVTQDSTNTYIQTDLTGPPPFSGVTTRFKVATVAAPEVTFINCDGPGNCLETIDYSQEAAHGRPIGEYSFRSHSQASGGPVSGGSLPSNISDYGRAFGKIISITVNVTTAAVCTGAFYTLRVCSQFGISICNMDTPADKFWDPSIDLKTAGERTLAWQEGGGYAVDIDPGIDNFRASELYNNTWLVKGIFPWINVALAGTITTYPEFTIEVITDQGIVPIDGPKLGVVTL